MNNYFALNNSGSTDLLILNPGDSLDFLLLNPKEIFMSYNIILPATTSAAISQTITLSQDMSAVTFICNGLATSETATLQIYEPISQTFVNVLPLVQLTASKNTITLAQTWGIFEFNKTVTAAAVGISALQYQAISQIRNA